MKWYLNALRKYFVFSGRARRKEYWIFMLINFIIWIIANPLDELIENRTFFDKLGFDGHSLPSGSIPLFFLLFILIPCITVTVRRLHDIGKSGWMIFITLIPIAGAIWLFILMLTGSSIGENEYGSNPKEIAAY